jgi:tetratricopeptide (TPR) repeat protein
MKLKKSKRLRMFLNCLFIIVFIQTVFSPLQLQANKPVDALQQKNKMLSKEIITSEILSPGNITHQQLGQPSGIPQPEETKSKTEKNVDREISFLTLVVTIIGVLVAILTLLAVIAIALGFLEIRRWGKRRESLEIIIEEAKKREEEIKPIVERIKKVENEVNKGRDQIKLPPLPEVPSNEIKNKLDEFAKKIEFLEAFGVPLKTEDYFSRGADFYYKGDYEHALEAYEKAIELKPDYAGAWCNKGVALGRLDRHEEALKAYEKAIELKPDYAGAWYNKDVALGKLGRYEEALKACEKAIELKPDFVSAWFNRACEYSLKRDKENMLNDLSKAIELKNEYKKKAKTDEDFKNYWDDEDFKRIVS